MEVIPIFLYIRSSSLLMTIHANFIQPTFAILSLSPGLSLLRNLINVNNILLFRMLQHNYFIYSLIIPINDDLRKFYTVNVCYSSATIWNYTRIYFNKNSINAVNMELWCIDIFQNYLYIPIKGNLHNIWCIRKCYY